MRIELMTPSLPRKCSTPELRRLVSWQKQFAVGNCTLQIANSIMSGRPGSNRPPEAWKATALPNELLPLINLKM